MRTSRRADVILYLCFALLIRSRCDESATSSENYTSKFSPWTPKTIISDDTIKGHDIIQDTSAEYPRNHYSVTSVDISTMRTETAEILNNKTEHTIKSPENSQHASTEYPGNHSSNTSVDMPTQRQATAEILNNDTEHTIKLSQNSQHASAEYPGNHSSNASVALPTQKTTTKDCTNNDTDDTTENCSHAPTANIDRNDVAETSSLPESTSTPSTANEGSQPSSSTTTETSSSPVSKSTPSTVNEGSQPISSTTSITVTLVLLGLTTMIIGFGGLYIFYRRKGSILPRNVATLSRFTCRSTSELFTCASEARQTKILKINFEEYYKDLNKDSGWKFSLQYEALRSFSLSYPTIEAKKAENMPSNRWIDILPYDHSLVKLFEFSLEDAIPTYINASYIPGHNSVRQYISTQGPMATTTNDFWKMVWLENSPVIVMLTKCKENMKEKCIQYWPTDNEPHTYGNLSVTLVSELECSDYVIRTLRLEPEYDLIKQRFSIESETGGSSEDMMEEFPLMALYNKKMEIKQFHYTAWPDRGCPKSPASLLRFILNIHDTLPVPSQGPTIVHCSAGIGRSGTFIAIHHLLEMFKDTGSVNVYATVEDMRKHRVNMVQTEAQYIFIHECLRELFNSAVTSDNAHL